MRTLLMADCELLTGELVSTKAALINELELTDKWTLFELLQHDRLTSFSFLNTSQSRIHFAISLRKWSSITNAVHNER